MWVERATLLIGLASLLLSGWSRDCHAAVIIVEKTAATEGEVKFTRTAIPQGPDVAGDIYHDRLSVGAGPVTLAGGDTVRFRLSMAADLAFELVPGHANELSVGFYATNGGQFYSGTTVLPAPRLWFTDSVNLTPMPTHADVAYYRDSTSTIYFVGAGVGYDLPLGLLADASATARFAGVEGEFVVPYAIPPTAFDHAFFVFVATTAPTENAPPPQLRIVPEPSSFGLLAFGSALLLCRCRKRCRTRQSPGGGILVTF